MKFSIIVPSYNQGRFIEATLQSILRQENADFECIVTDGGSSDETLDILKKYNQELTWISEPDNGQSDAINKGIRMSSGDLVGWLCSDDILFPGALQRVDEAFHKHKQAAVVHGDGAFIDIKGKRIMDLKGQSFDLKETLAARGAYCTAVIQPGSFCQRAAWEDVGGVREELHYMMDRDLWLRLVGHGYPFVYIPEELAGVRWHSLAKTKGIDGNVNTDRAKETVRVIREYFDNPSNPFTDDAGFEKECVARAHFESGMIHYEGMNFEETRKCFRQACKIRKRTLFDDRSTMLRVWANTYLGKSAVSSLRRVKGSLCRSSERGKLMDLDTSEKQAGKNG